jgi:hypothetical protein
MDSFKTGAGALTVANTVVELTTVIYLAKKFSETSNTFNQLAVEQKVLHDNINQIFNKLAEEGKSHFGISISEHQKKLEKLDSIQKQTYGAVNELIHFKADMEERLDRIEQCMEMIIQALSDKDIHVSQPKPKPISWFAKSISQGRGNTNNSEKGEKGVSFGKNTTKNISSEDEIEDEEDDIDEDTRALIAFRRAKKNKNKY